MIYQTHCSPQVLLSEIEFVGTTISVTDEDGAELYQIKSPHAAPSRFAKMTQSFLELLAEHPSFTGRNKS